MVKYGKSFLIIFIFFGRILFAQGDLLNEYVKYGLESNLALNQQKISLEQSIQSLKEARGMFFPSINIDARYSRAGGGRIIDFPVGDLLNPVYQTLNQMLGQQRFPQIENETIDFLREEEHDTKIRLIQPIFQPAIYYNYKAKSYEKDLHEAELNVFKRQLTAEIKSAYFNYLKAIKVVDIYNKTKLLLIENLRISNKLFHAKTVTKDVIYRAKSELSSLQQQLMVAQNQQKLAQSYFNFLLNKPLTSVITIEENMQLPGKQELTFEMAQTNALENREELVQLKNAIYATDNGISAQRSNYFPGLTAVLDYGFEGKKYDFGKDNDYWMASMVLQWNLFNGFQDQAKVEYAALEKKKLESKLNELKQQIGLQVRQSFDNLYAAKMKVEVAGQQLNTSKESFKIINKKYEQGMSSYIEFLDARTNFTNSEINRILAQYDYFIKHAEFEKITAYSKL